MILSVLLFERWSSDCRPPRASFHSAEPSGDNLLRHFTSSHFPPSFSHFVSFYSFLLSGLKRLQSIILGFGAPEVSDDENVGIRSDEEKKVDEKDEKMYTMYVDQLLLGGLKEGKEGNNDEKEEENDFGGEEGFYFR